MLLLIILSEVELLLINDHFSYARAAYGCSAYLRTSLISLASFKRLLPQYYNRVLDL